MEFAIEVPNESLHETLPADFSPPRDADGIDRSASPPCPEDGGAEDGEDKERRTVFRDIRRYYCGICRSKKSLIRTHMLAHHKDEIPNIQDNASSVEAEASEHVSHTCQECGANFRKPGYLKQHMQSHSLGDLGFSNDEKWCRISGCVA